MSDAAVLDPVLEEDLLDQYLQRPIIVEDPCPHGIPVDLCAALCSGDPTAVATVHLHRPVGHSLALDCQLAGAAPHLLTDAQILDVVEGAERLQRWVSALRTRMIAVFADRHPAGSRAAPPDADPRAIAPVSRWLPDQVAMVLSLSREQALGEIAGAQRFVHVLPATLADWEAGRIDERKADAIAQATIVLDDDLAREVEAKVLTGAAEVPRRLLQDRLRRAVAKADPDGATRRHQRAKADRRMSISHGEEGMASLWLGGTAEQAEASWRSVDRLARAVDAADPRTLDQKRIDTAHELLQGTLTLTDLTDVHTVVDHVLATVAARQHQPGNDTPAEVPADARAEVEVTGVSAEVVAEAVAQALAHKPDPNTVIGRKPLIHVVVGLDTLLGGDTPGELVGHGPIPALTARALAAEGVLKRLVTDPLSGYLINHGRTTYSPPEPTDDHVRARDCTCRGPLCAKPIRDLDHHIPWADEGPTDADNLNGYCLGHHKLKDAPGWQVLAHPDGSLTWISPCGRRRTTHPHDYRPFTDPTPDRTDSAGRTDVAERSDSADRTGSAGRTDLAERIDLTERTDLAERTGRPADTVEDSTGVHGADADDVPPPF
ncbi:HNH endonuclease signature motif containing protein [Pseudonocardia parietis]|uniref:DUF222 domain-containing protein n=1 Tax=Pseudonocardia parietis TaxID=570936 RepID=A0ABS4W2V3_9PSEU|nr:HNH endonuclease signature motif containing protein [Pseudonocardia parietis]MBP2370346.1 hypothetical protein [Pseudonocardia parietis]